MIKAICFDLDGVYFTKGSFVKFKQAIGIKSTVEKTDFVFHGSAQILDYKKGLITENEFWDYARQELCITYTNEEIFKMLRDSYTVDEKVVDVVKQIKKLGYKTCICSNNFEARIKELDEKFDFLKDFDVQIFSYKVGVTKPDKRIFEELVKTSGINPNEILYSDDSPEKLVGAKELGINVFVYENFAQFLETIKSFGVALA
jgi:epoxide hydrolase-like predicted phosphatase